MGIIKRIVNWYREPKPKYIPIAKSDRKDYQKPERLRRPLYPHKIKCTKCKEYKPSSEFYADKRKRNGLKSWCYRCSNLARSISRRKK